MANTNILSIGRFSSQMLTYLGTQRTVKNVFGGIGNTYKYETGTTVYPSPGSVSQAALGAGVVGSYSLSDYNSVLCYFLSRGATQVYAETMTALVIDMATIVGITPGELLVKSEIAGKTIFSSDAYSAFNLLRDTGNQVGRATSVDNKRSLQARQIRS
jgi:hypothetical protein